MLGRVAGARGAGSGGLTEDDDRLDGGGGLDFVGGLAAGLVGAPGLVKVGAADGAAGSAEGANTLPGRVSSSPIAGFRTGGATAGLRTDAIDGALGLLLVEGGPVTVGARSVVGAG